MDKFFPASYSCLSSQALAQFIVEKYQLPAVVCKLLVRGVGDTYLVMSDKRKFIMRVYRSSHRTLPQIKEEINLLLALHSAQVPVSYPIACGSKAYVLSVNAIEGERHLVLFSYAPGQSVRILNDNQLRNLGREMARFHNVSAKFVPDGSRWKLDINTTCLEPLKRIRPALSDDLENYSWLENTVKRVEKKFSTIDSASFAKGYCHFDFLPKNFHFENDAVTFFDFDFMGYGWLVNDIMSFWQHLCLETYTARTTREAADQAYGRFLDAYRQTRAISEAELDLVPFLAVGFWLFYMGFHTTHDQFYTQCQPSQVKAYIGVIKYIVNTHWTPEDQ
ncbi:phosphotransferase enzyme family protein [Pedobacter deserti]|uniref:phosphotransferase enzyme family protein n=1 Tax=Pedobacter deserti TaxID=2817382 RepID=UPI00210AD004|nr:phosphotransferase [Pedobacter sp. SYSU D00382]